MSAPAWVLPDDWGRVLAPDAPLLETFARVTIVYFVLLIVMRVVLKREAAGLSVRDLLVIVLVADAGQNGLAGHYASVANALVAGLALVFWDYTLSAVEYRWPTLRRLLEPGPLVLVRDGRLVRRNMAKELITEDDLLTQIRQQGCERLEQVRLAVMERDGRISVIPRCRHLSGNAPRAAGPGRRPERCDAGAWAARRHRSGKAPRAAGPGRRPERCDAGAWAARGTGADPHGR